MPHKHGPPSTAALHHLHAGEIIIVMGNSSSLLEMDMNLLDRHLILGVQRLLDTYVPDYLFVVDAHVVKEQAANMMAVAKTCRMLLYPRAMSSENRKHYRGPWLETPFIANTGNPLAESGPLHIGASGNSGYQATQLAYRMGPQVIALAGIDLFWPKGKHTHCYGYGRRRGARLGDVPGLTRDFMHLKAEYARRDVRLTSVSPWHTPFRSAVGFTPLERLHKLLD